MTNRSDVSWDSDDIGNNIQDCRNVWLIHLENCRTCQGFKVFLYREPTKVCEQGRALYDEYCKAREADQDKGTITS